MQRFKKTNLFSMKSCLSIFIGIIVTVVSMTVFGVLESGQNNSFWINSAIPLPIAAKKGRGERISPMLKDVDGQRQQLSSTNKMTGNKNYGVIRNVYTTTKSKLNLNVISMHADVNDRRLDVIKDKCSDHVYVPLWNNSAVEFNGRIYSIPNRINYCETPKVGCTFWKSVLRYIAKDYPSKGQIRKPSDIDRNFVHNGKWKNIKYYTYLGKAIHDGAFSKGYNFMIAREPYSRLWSAYIDKFYLPDFWHTYGPTFRNAKGEYCVNDISFEEFLSFVVNHSKHLDNHWTPIYRLCNPCGVKYDAIGKIETFSNDSKYILKMLGQSKLIDKENMYKQSRAKEEIVMLSKFNFGFKNRTCFDSKLIAKRLWSVFQMNGYIHKKYPFPTEMFQDDNFYRKENISNVFTRFAFNALEDQEISDLDLKAQKYQYMIDGYKTIPLSLLYKVQMVYKFDFELFGYNVEPKDIFSR